MKYITVLGSTGSIGVNTLDVLRRHPEQFSVFALTASRNVDLLLAQCEEFKPRYAVLISPEHALSLQVRLQQAGLSTEVLVGAAALDQVAAHSDVDMVMAAIVGAAGLSSCIAAALAGKRLLLANKEALVVGGDVFMSAVKQGGATLLPIDSEHSAIFQSLPDDRAHWSSVIDKLILTASGGPFRTWGSEQIRAATPEQACAHPNWVMGRKISVDSATMMNKALEVIEAKFLFDVQPRQIDVVIHPQSVVHSMVQYVDNSVVAQLGTPDMRGPIAYGLAWPQRVVSGSAALDFSSMAALTFESIHSEAHRARFPGLALAWETLEGQAGSTVVLNAANEIAVAAFLNREIRFDQIHAVNTQTLQQLVFSSPMDLPSLVALDAEARSLATRCCAVLRN
ncbi:1-deoxy-D-xylulose-5-phosphate reductoisomerase [Rhodoferax bucti]|uniref:1-deoxy-D-xylulose-5-phosphate reductoisomerase n=1 Tax=Rhodoferax bucti TaxID=2576305 RepID=UPI001109E718|nr:1-deoxy-D-xylulose-5-phosphate reductoisomerase [Rhodoferax bucti]